MIDPCVRSAGSGLGEVPVLPFCSSIWHLLMFGFCDRRDAKVSPQPAIRFNDGSLIGARTGSKVTCGPCRRAPSAGFSETGWIGLRRLPRVPERRALKGFDRPGAIEVDHRIELLAETGVEVVTPTFGLGAIDDPDCPL